MKKWFALLVLGFGLTVSAQAADLPDFTELMEKQSPAVVNITTTQERRAMPQGHGRMPDPGEMFDFFRRFVPPEGERFMPPRRGNGSGFVISEDGYILTNAHVVEDSDELVVKLNDRREYRAKVVGTDSRTDVALIKIEARNLHRVMIGNPNKLRVGEWVAAIGAPFGFENSITAGIVSAKGRSLPQENYVPFIQTDVAVNPGNSGGPLFNLRGEVVGVNSQILSRSGGYMGVSFAIPIDVAMDVAEQLKQGGKVSRGRLGVLIQDVTADLADSFGLSKPQGALVSEVEPGSPADKAGILASDVIIRFDGRSVESSIDLPRMVGATRPGSKVSLSVWRKGAAKEMQVTVGEMPAEGPTSAMGGDKEVDRTGLAVAELDPEQKRQLGIRSGVLVENASGAAARAGVRPGDVILAVNNREVNNAADLQRMINDAKRNSVALLVKRGKGSLYLPLRLDR